MGKQGFVRMRVDGEIYEISDPPKLAKTKKHTLEVVVDRLTVRPDIQQRLTDSLETAMKLAGGLVIVNVVGGEDMLFSQNYACPDCNISIEELTPRMFSFNNPYGACPTCSGLGVLLKMDPNMVIPDRSKSLAHGAIQVSGWNSAEPDSMAQMYFKGLADKYGFSLDTPVCELSDDVVDKLLYGTHGEKIHLEYKREDGGGSFNAPFEGIVTNLERRYRETHSDAMKQIYEGYMAHVPCPECGGKRLKREALAVTVGDKSIAEVSDMSIDRARAFLANVELTERQKLIAKQVLKEIDSRLRFLSDVGLDYLTLSRSAGTLSGGEAQRIRLATQIGSSLMGVLYILDEPSIGLHQRDNARLLKTLKGLRDLGNTLIVVEHDEETMLASDYIVDVGPGAGIHGGEIVACGTPTEIMESPRSITGAYLSGRRKVPVPAARRKPSGYITVRGARAHNLKNIDVRFPLGVMTCVTGVSGSGKSSLVNEILFKSLSRQLNRSRLRAGDHDTIEGVEQLDQDHRHRPVAHRPHAALQPRHLYRRVRPHPRRVCRHQRRSRPRLQGQPLQLQRQGRPLRGLLRRRHPQDRDALPLRRLRALRGLRRQALQPRNAGGALQGKKHLRGPGNDRGRGAGVLRAAAAHRRQTADFAGCRPRLRQARPALDHALRRRGAAHQTGHGTFPQGHGPHHLRADEPTTGLHVADVEKLDQVLDRLAGAGNTLVVIEHNLDVIKTADYIIDMGPEGGDRGGTVIAEGTPEEVARCEGSYTGMFLKKVLN